jgi:hypothetical protein
VTQISNLLAGAGGATVTYLDSLDAPAASTTLTLAVQEGGNSPNLTGSDTATINIAAVNDAPDLTPNAPTNATYAENAAAVQLLSTGANADVDNPANYSGGSLTVAITTGLVGGDQIVLRPGAPFTVVGGFLKDGSNNTIGTVTGLGTGSVSVTALTTFATPAVVNLLVAAFGYQSSSDPGAGNREVTFTFNDGGNTGGGALPDGTPPVQIVQVTPANDAPVNTAPAGVQTIPNSNFVFSGANAISIADPDGGATTRPRSRRSR